MVKMVNIHEAKTNLSALLVRIAGGEEIVIAKAGKPIGRLVPERRKNVRRKTGSAKNRLRISADFDTPLPRDVLAEFER